MKKKIKKTAIVGVLALLLVVGFVVVNAIQSNQPAENLPTGTCSSQCGNACTAESNCGKATCGAANGGTCGCR